MTDEAGRSGFACMVGRPNAGKSTLINGLVGTKIVITSPKPQTTRRIVRGVITKDQTQLIVVDTPGMHRPRTLLGERLNDLVRSTWSEVDVICFCLAADEDLGPGDRLVANEIAKVARKPIVVAVTKTDVTAPDRVIRRLASIAELADEIGLKVSDYVPTSAVTGANMDVLFTALSRNLPAGPLLFPADQLTDESEEALVAELIREAALADVNQELPHSIAVTVEEMNPREGRPDAKPMTDIYATIHVERSSQKPIIIGKGGQRLTKIGSTARESIERLIGTAVYLNLHVRVAKEWQRDSKQLRRLGF